MDTMFKLWLGAETNPVCYCTNVSDANYLSFMLRDCNAFVGNPGETREDAAKRQVAFPCPVSE